jgi:diguanylate cyclase (GGDEF)-like protein
MPPATRSSPRFFRFLSPRGRDAAWWIMFGGSLAMPVMLGLLGSQLYLSRQDTLAHAAENAHNLALLLDHDLSRNLEAYRTSLDILVRGFGEPSVMALPEPVRRQVLFGPAIHPKHVNGALILDREGRVVLDSKQRLPPGTSFEDREYFQLQRTASDPDAHIIGRPFVSQRSGRPVISMSRRLEGPDGAFAGVAVMGIDIAYFEELLSGVRLGAHGMASIRRTDGTLVMRYPALADVVGRSMRGTPSDQRIGQSKEGSFRATSTLDGIERMYVYRQVAGSDFVVVVAPAIDDILRPWMQRALFAGGAMALFGLGTLALALMLSRELRARARAERELRELATTDALTGVLNRRALNQALNQAWPRVQRAGTDLSLLFVDIDYFKSYNDTFGHQAGDAVLSTVARVIRQSIHRPDDQVARYGGEEFLVLLPETSPEGALLIAESLRNAVRALDIAHSGSPHRQITVSVGVATHRSSTSQRFPDADALIQAADNALYHAKGAGRNTTRVYQSAR